MGKDKVVGDSMGSIEEEEGKDMEDTNKGNILALVDIEVRNSKFSQHSLAIMRILNLNSNLVNCLAFSSFA